MYPNMNLKSDSKLQIFNTGGGTTLGKNSTQFHKTFLTDLFSHAILLQLIHYSVFFLFRGYNKSNHLPLLYVMKIMLNLNVNRDFQKAFLESFSSNKFLPYEKVSRGHRNQKEEIMKKKQSVQKYLRRS